MPCIPTGALPVHINCSPPLEPETEDQVSELWTEAATIVSRMKTPPSKITDPLKRLRPDLSDLEKDMVRDELKREISAALEDVIIPQRMRDKMTLVFVSLLMEVMREFPGKGRKTSGLDNVITKLLKMGTSKRKHGVAYRGLRLSLTSDANGHSA